MASDKLGGRKTLNVAGFLNEFEKDDIKRRVDIVQLFAHFGIALEKKGKSLAARCPWHDDKTPSLSVDADKGLYNCFGCGESGDVFSLVEKMRGCGFKEALEFLKAFAGKNLPVQIAGAEVPSAPEPEPWVQMNPKSDANVPINISLDTVCDFCHKKMYENRNATNYFTETRKIDGSLIQRFKIGFSDGSLLKIVSNGQKESLKALGIITKKGREHFYGCIIFPVLDDIGHVVGMYGRRITEEEPKHLYLSGSHKSVFNLKASRVYDEIILVESIIDCLSLISLGIENVQPLYGTNGFTQEHLQILKDDNVKTIVLSLDNDDAGRKAAETLKTKLLDEGFAVKTIFPKLSKDWNEELLAGLSKETFKLYLEEAEAEKRQEPDTCFTVKREGIKDVFKTDVITYEIVGAKELFVTNLRVNVKALCAGQSYYDNADLASGRSRRALSETLSALFSIEYKIVERDLMRILDYYAEERDKKLSALGSAGEKIELTEEERKAGMEFLTNPAMFDELTSDMETLGYVGEDLNKILLYLVASSRILDDPISALILSQSAAGKSLLISTLKKLIPSEDVISVTSLSDQALNYVPSMLHKFLDLGEAVHSEIIEHQIREMLSAKELCRLVTIKDEKTGQLKSELKKTPAIVAAVMTTTRQNLNPENASRFFVINTDESKEQTHRIHAAQREKYSLERCRIKSEVIPQIVRKHLSAQRLLKKRVIVNNFTHHLDFPDTLMRVRRDHERFIDLIACVCFVRQYRKEVKNAGGSTGSPAEAGSPTIEYIECDIDDYRIAYNIMINGVLASTMIELSKSAAELYEAIRELAKAQAKKKNLKVNEITFTQREIREQTGCGQSWIRENMRKLVEYEYVSVQRNLKRGERGSYRLKDDSEMEKIDLSMIPAPEAMEQLIFKNRKSEQSEQK
jgi:DNA primase